MSGSIGAPPAAAVGGSTASAAEACTGAQNKPPLPTQLDGAIVKPHPSLVRLCAAPVAPPPYDHCDPGPRQTEIFTQAPCPLPLAHILDQSRFRLL